MGVIYRYLPSLRAIYLLLYLYGYIGALMLIGESSLHLSGPFVGAIWLLMALPIAYTLFWKSRQHRLAILTGYFYSDSSVSRLFRGGIFMGLVAVFLGLILSLGLLVATSQAKTESAWLVLALIMPFWVFSHCWLGRYLKNQTKRRCLSYVTGQILFWFWGISLLLLLVGQSFFVPVADLKGVDFWATLDFYSGQVEAQSGAYKEILALLASLDGAVLWGAQNLVGDVSSRFAKTLLWFVVFFRDWLFVWPFLLLCQLGYFRIYRYD